jgi:hypothetical protein
VGTREFPVWSPQRPGLTAFDAQLQRQPAKLFQQQPLLPTAAANLQCAAAHLQHAAAHIQQLAEQRESRLLAAPLLQSAAYAFLFGAANLFRTEPQLFGSVALLLRT